MPAISYTCLYRHKKTASLVSSSSLISRFIKAEWLPNLPTNLLYVGCDIYFCMQSSSLGFLQNISRAFVRQNRFRLNDFWDKYKTNGPKHTTAKPNAINLFLVVVNHFGPPTARTLKLANRTNKTSKTRNAIRITIVFSRGLIHAK